MKNEITDDAESIWYKQYGPEGTGDVVQIECFYVASNGSGVGCNFGNVMSAI